MSELSAISADQRASLRHPLEPRVSAIVFVLDVMVVALIVGLLYWGTEWLETRPNIGRYAGNAKLLLAAVLAAPLVATFARVRRRALAQEESIRVSDNQLPEIYEVLVRHCARLGVSVPQLYLSDGIDHTTSFSWHGHQSIILATDDFEAWPDAFDDVIDFQIARELGSICLGYTSFARELLKSSVAPIPFLRGPLNMVQTYSCDRYGAFLAPRAIRAVIVTATGDRLRNRVNLKAFLAQLDEEANRGVWINVLRVLSKRVPLAHRVQELRRAGLLTMC